MIVYAECLPEKIENQVRNGGVFTEDQFNEIADYGQTWTKCELKPISIINITKYYVKSKEEIII